MPEKLFSCEFPVTQLESYPGNLEMNIKQQQMKYIGLGVALLPFSPFLYLQGRYTRFKVGRLPDAEGDTSGVVGVGKPALRILAIGESTVAGVGASTHREALSGQFAEHLSRKTGQTVEWHAIGKSGITISETLVELVPQIPDLDFDLFVVALGGNDVFGFSSPVHWRSKLLELIQSLQSKNRKAHIFLANIPMIRDFIAMPDPLRYFLSRFAKMQHFNTIDIMRGLNDVYYFRDVERVDEDFFADGIHPSPSGYSSWSESMVNAYLKQSGRTHFDQIEE